ncbi:hypothetical protein Slala02_69350 [Streptomyces lavendulae subsp. lavendulae]|nr:hypothetical protein Slala01_25950 [Streptomyces lavendulae subsp. lavendulae]GLX31116.1 hypothetical protein Slala02_69350 [Streptomyces lavendulae subsp. lavendulae]
MRDRVLDEGDDIGIGDLTCGEIGENERTGDMQRLLQGGRVVHGDIVNPDRAPDEEPLYM